MRIFLANIDSGVLPERAWALMQQAGHEVAGNWAPPIYRADFDSFSPSTIIYAPHRQLLPLPWRPAAISLSLEAVKDLPTILWALYPDYLTGWDQERNDHDDSFLESVRILLPHVRPVANSWFTKRLLEERAPEATFDVCYLGIDTEGIDSARSEPTLDTGIPDSKSVKVLWHHRWATDKNLHGAIDLLLELAPRHPEATFLLGRKDNWDEDYWVPAWLREEYARKSPQLEALPNIQYCPYFEKQAEYWHFLSSIHLAFSCSFHETFGIAMLEQAYAGAACVVPDRAAYPEVHSGAPVIQPSDIGSSIEELILHPAARKGVARRSKANASEYTLERVVDTLLALLPP